MTILIDPKLKNYMEKHGHNAIVLDVSLCHTWAGVVKDLSARFADSNETDSLSEKGYTSMETEAGNVYFKSGRIAFKEKVLFSLSSFLWSRQINVLGARAV